MEWINPLLTLLVGIVLARAIIGLQRRLAQIESRLAEMQKQQEKRFAEFEERFERIDECLAHLAFNVSRLVGDELPD